MFVQKLMLFPCKLALDCRSAAIIMPVPCVLITKLLYFFRITFPHSKTFCWHEDPQKGFMSTTLK